MEQGFGASFYGGLPSGFQGACVASEAQGSTPDGGRVRHATIVPAKETCPTKKAHSPSAAEA